MSRIFQNVILQLKDLYNRRMGVIDSNGSLTACTYGILDSTTVDYILKKYSDPNAFYSYESRDSSQPLPKQQKDLPA